MKTVLNFGLAAAVLAFAACGDPVPLQEMTAAKKGITNAERVMAEKYAADELKAATDLLLESHSLVKDEDYKGAAGKALLSEQKAKEAYDKAAPLLAQDSISVAEESIKAADEAFASELAKDEFDDANNKLKKAQGDFEAKQYEDAYMSALDADVAAKNARNSAIGRKSMLGDAIEEVKVTLREAQKYSAETIAKEKYDAANENLAGAEKAYDELMLKQGFEYIDNAKVNADEAYQAALKETALDKIQQAKDSAALAENSKGASLAAADLKASKELIDTAERQFNDGLYLDSIDSANESLRLSGLVMQAGSDSDKYASSSAASDKTDVSKEPSSVSEDETDYIIYKVKWFEAGSKDCLWRIAGKFYNNPRKWKVIYEANRDIIRNPHWIFPGWKLRIPKNPK